MGNPHGNPTLGTLQWGVQQAHWHTNKPDRQMRRVLQIWCERGKAAAFASWRGATATSQQAMQLVRQVVTSWQIREVRGAWHQLDFPHSEQIFHSHDTLQHGHEKP